MLISFLSFSQDWNDRASSGVGLSSFSLGLILQGQTKYPKPSDFAQGSTLFEINKPIWGTCPN